VNRRGARIDSLLAVLVREVEGGVDVRYGKWKGVQQQPEGQVSATAVMRVVEADLVDEGSNRPHGKSVAREVKFFEMALVADHQVNDPVLHHHHLICDIAARGVEDGHIGLLAPSQLD
jgi:hypothetical protein